MINTVLVESKTRQRLRLASLLLFIIFALFIVMLVCVKMIDKQNLNGDIAKVTGTITKVSNDDGINISISSDGKESEYNIVWGDTVAVNIEDYVNKTVTIIIPQKTFAWSNPWVLGLEINNETVVDHQTVIQQKKASNDEMILISAILTGITGVATCAVFIWRFNVSPTVERPLAEQYCEYLRQRQPACPERKKMLIALCVWLLIWAVLLILLAGFAPENDGEPLGVTATVFLVLFVAASVVGIVAFPIVSRFVLKKEIDFYAERLPFDFTDISHAPLKKSVKTELERQMKQERERYPYIHGDGGNGYDVEFTEKGVNLYVNFDMEEQRGVADVSSVFPDMPSESGVFDGISSPQNSPVLSLSYEELNFEAVAHYRRIDHPMMVIIKSRLDRRGDFPEEFVNDIHLALDVHLLNTLKTFNVNVENLQYILDNKKDLMMTNCYMKRSKSK